MIFFQSRYVPDGRNGYMVARKEWIKNVKI